MDVPETRLRITELFHSLQGESSFAGRPCGFVRLTGCHLRCTWCDSEYTFHGGTWMSLPQILEQVAAWQVELVEVTGGEPLLQKNVHPLLTALCDAGHTVLLETSGACDITPVDPRVIKIVDVKCPGSGEEGRNLWSNLEHLGPRDEVKFVVADRADYEYAVGVIRQYGLELRGEVPPLISPVHGRIELTELARWVLEDRLKVRFQIQLHKYIWGADVKGV